MYNYLGESEMHITKGKKPNPKQYVVMIPLTCHSSKGKQKTDFWLLDVQAGLERVVNRKEDGQGTF